MRVSLVVGMTVGAIGTYALLGHDMKLDKMVKKMAKKVKTKYKEMME